MLVGNKSDRTMEREVTAQDGSNLARRLGCDFIEASAKNCVNVERAFYDVVRQLRRQKSTAAASRPRPERRTTPSSRPQQSERYGSDNRERRRRRRTDGGSRCVIL